MERNEAIDICKSKFVIYQAMTEFVLFPDHREEISILIHGAIKSNTNLIRWGSVYMACMKSQCFHPMDQPTFISMCRGVLPGDPPAPSTLKKGIEAITKAFQTEKNCRNNDKDAEWREYTRNLANAIRVACGLPLVEIK